MSNPSHFAGKTATDHVQERRADGLKQSAEIHGAETPGHVTAGADTAREMTIVLLLLWTVLQPLPLFADAALVTLGVFALGWLVWKMGRSGWLAWSRLERLHRLIEEERWEIEHHRPQEREELEVLYASKGFEGKLLEEVVDVLMADNDRLLRVMLEEEMGLKLEGHEHPLKQSLGAGVGGVVAALIVLAATLIFGLGGLVCSTFLILAVAAAISARYQKNKLLPAMIWNLALGGLVIGIAYYVSEILGR